MKPTRSVLDKSFRYKDSVSTDIQKTFARIRRELAQQVVEPPPAVVQQLRKNGTK